MYQVRNITAALQADERCHRSAARKRLGARKHTHATAHATAPRGNMGAGSSSLLNEEIEEICECTKLSQTEVKNLYLRFLRLDKSRTGKLNVDSLMMIPELAMNPLAPRLTAIFAESNFRQFAELIAVFSHRAEPQTKRDFLFRVYDIDGDGVIGRDDLTQVMQLLLGEHDDEGELLKRVVDDIFKHADKNGDGVISPDEFDEVVEMEHVQKRATVDL